MNQKTSDLRKHVGDYLILHRHIKINLGVRQDVISKEFGLANNLQLPVEYEYNHAGVYEIKLKGIIPYAEKVTELDHITDIEPLPKVLYVDDERVSLDMIYPLTKILEVFSKTGNEWIKNMQYKVDAGLCITKPINNLSLRFVCLPVSIHCIEVGEWLGIFDPVKDRTGNICSNFAKVIGVERERNHTILAYTVRRNGEWDENYQVIDSKSKTTQADGYFKVVCGVTYIDESKLQEGLTFEEDTKAHRRLRKIK